MDRIIQNFKKAHPVKQAILLLWGMCFSGGIIYSVFFLAENGLQDSLTQILGAGLSAKTVLIFWLIFILRNVFFLPMALLLVMSPVVFGFWPGILIAGIGQILGAIFGFLFARYYGQEFFETKNSKMMNLVNDKLENYGVLSIVLLRIIPIFPYDIINFATGFSRISLGAFTGATILSVWPDCFFYGFLGGSLNNPTSLLYAVSFGILIFGFLYYLKTHPKFKDFFIMKVRSRIKNVRKKISTIKRKRRGKKRF